MKISKLKSELNKLPKGFVVLVTVNSKEYFRTNIEIIKFLANDENVPGVYVTVNKPYQVMIKVLKENKINTKSLKFIDCITSVAGGKPEKTEDCLFISSPQNLTDLGVAMDQALKALPEDDKFLFLDSLSTLLIYNSVGTVAKFSHFLTSRMKLMGLRGVLISLEGETDPQLLSQLSQFCDGVIDLDGV